MARAVVLPSWAKALSKGVVAVAAEKFYPEILKELGVADRDRDCYWLEVAKAVMKMDILTAVAGTDMAAKQGGALSILVEDGSKAKSGVSEWAQSAHPIGKGAKAGAADARGLYRKLRGFVPA